MIQELINFEKYPIDQPDSEQYKLLMSECQERLVANNLINMEGFLTYAGTAELLAEIDNKTSQTFHCVNHSRPDFTAAYEAKNGKQLANYLGTTDRYALARHQLLGSKLDELYQYEPLRNFVRDLLALDKIYLHEDPSNALVVQLYKTGGGIAWHFDQALFSTILNLCETEQGGTFECVPDLRTADDPCFDEVRDVLLNKSDRVEQYHAKAGSFTIMLGRYTMHRVTEVLGETPRVSVVLSYEDKPGIKLDLATRKRFFGPTVADNP